MIIMAFNGSAFKEYVLPNTVSTDYSLYISRDIFSLKHSFFLRFEIVRGRWTLCGNNGVYQVIHHKIPADEVTLGGQELLQINLSSGETVRLLTFSRELSFDVYKKFTIVGCKSFTIGKAETNSIIYDFRGLVSKTHCTIALDYNGYVLTDHSSNGVFVNNRRVKGSHTLKFGDVVTVFGLSLVYLGDMVAVNSHAGEVRISPDMIPVSPEKKKDSRPHRQSSISYYNRSPRRFYTISNEEVAIEAPSNPSETKKKSLFMTIGPSFTMAIPMTMGFLLMILSANASGMQMGAFMYMGLVTAIGSALFGAMWAFLNVKESKRGEYEDEIRRFNMYGNYLLDVSKYIGEKYRQNREAMLAMYPSAEDCCALSESSTELWCRNISHPDFLFLRLGLGDIDFQVHIKIPDEKFSLVTDPLKEKPAVIYENYRILRSVPVGVDCMTHSLYGIAGGKHKRGAYEVAHLLIAQIAAAACYTDAKIVFCFNASSPSDMARWEYVKWIPHVWADNRSIRFFAASRQETSEVLFELADIIRKRAEDAGYGGSKTSFFPHYFLFLTDIKLIEGELISKYVFDKDHNYGLTTFIMTDYYSNLPNSCEDIIENDENFRGVFNTIDTMQNPLAIDFDPVSPASLDGFAKRLSGVTVREIEEEVGLATSLTFFEMYGAKTLADLEIPQRWRKNKTYTSMQALIGKKAGGGNCYLDIHEKHHGPHGLIAGTTGSGKSEFIGTYLLSLAVNYSPDDVAFFIIDFKGGGMGNSFLGLPHMAGQISNLSGSQIRRAMISIKSENLRRQRLFSDYGINHISSYTQLYKSGKATTPMPHLLIVIDEFAELKREEPDFMREIISVAQVGRSLGVHLILATQKPAGTVDDNIWSNSKFRLCLRVQDRQDSNDMLHKPDAAFITQAGRGYLQVGNDELYELFQSGWSGAEFKNGSDDAAEIATMITHTGQTALVGNHTRMLQKEREKQLWYLFLMQTTVKLSGGHYGNDALNDNTALCKAVLAAAKDAGYNTDSSEADIQALRRFISLIPTDISNEDKAVREIMVRAAEKRLVLPEYKEKTQLEALVEHIIATSKEEGYSYRTGLWMPLLPSRMALSDVVDMSRLYHDGCWQNADALSVEVAVGMYDDPWNQTQLPLRVDFSKGGHLAVCGAVSSGKSTFLQTLLFSLAMKYTPAQVGFYILDFSSGMLAAFERFPHMGGVIRESEPDRLEKFFNMIEHIIEERKTILNGGSFSEYNKTNTDDLPALFIVIDNFAGFKEKTDNQYENTLVRLSREGENYGLFLVMTSAGFGMAEIQNRIGDNVRTVISLEMSDKFRYMDVLRTTRLEIQPEAGIKGRGLSYVDNRLLEFQTAVAVNAPDDYQRSAEIEKIGAAMRAAWKGAYIRQIPSIPQNPTYADISILPEYREAVRAGLLPFAYNDRDASVYSVNPARTYCYSITGKRRTGKTNVLRLLMASLSGRDGTMAVIEKGSRELKAQAAQYGMRYLTDDESVNAFFREITSTFVERNQYKKELVESGMSDNRIVRKMQKFPPIYIFIADLVSFVKDMRKADSAGATTHAFFENIFEKGQMHNVFFFACINTDDVASIAGERAYNLYVDYKTGVHLGGNLSSQRVFNFQNLHYSMMSKAMKQGEGLIPDENDDTFAHKIIIPLYGEDSE